jgi:hypothetical protein
MSRLVSLVRVVILATLALAITASSLLAQEASPSTAELPPIGNAFATAWSSGDPAQVAAIYAEDGIFEEVVVASVLDLAGDGLIAHDREYWDLATLLAQVGALPAAEATPAA